MNVAMQIEAPVPSVADAERDLAGEQDALADARRACAGAEADLSAARSRLAEDPTDDNAEAVELARREATKFSELVQARESRVAMAERRLADARRAEDREELVQVEREASAHLAELPSLFAELVEIHRSAAAVVDRIEDLAEAHGELHDRARGLAARLGQANPLRRLTLPVIRTAAGLYLAEMVGRPEHAPEDLRQHSALVRAFSELREARLDAGDLGPALDRFLLEIDSACGITVGRFLEPLAEAQWAALGESRERYDAAEALLDALAGGGSDG